MATVSQNREVVRTIRRRLSGLRRKLSTWIFVHGLGRWLLIILSVFAVDMFLDRVFKMDFAQRAIMLVVMAIIASFFLFRKLLRPMSHQIDDESLLMKVEDKNEESGQSIISSYQLAQDKQLKEKGISTELADATIEQGLSKAQKVNFGSALNHEQANKNWMILLGGVVLAGLLSLGVWFGTQILNSEETDATATPQLNLTASDSTEPDDASQSSDDNPINHVNRFLGVWFNRNIMLGDAQWPQGTYLEIAGAKDGKIIVAQGSDHIQKVMILEKSTRKDVEVSLEIDGPNGRTIHQMKATGADDGREFRFVFHNVSSKQRFRAFGGDGETEWVELELVEPPSVEQLNLQATLPGYTGLKPFILEGAGPHGLLAASQVQIEINSNKPLQKCSLKIDDNLLEMSSKGGESTTFTTILGIDHPLTGGKYDFVLVDERGLSNNRSASFTLKIKEDKKPKVRASMVGISGKVVPRAIIPTNFSVIDDFGISKIEFDCQWNDSEGGDEGYTRQISIFSPAQGEISIEREGQQILQMEPFNLKPDTSFRFAIATTDTNPDVPGYTKSRDFLIRIVTEEELRSDLLRREIEQRKAFQQAYDAQLALISDLRATAAMSQQDMSSEEFASIRTQRLLTLDRNQKLVGTNISGVADRFSEFLLEVKNNRLDEDTEEIDLERTLKYRFGELIVAPIRELDEKLIWQANRYLDNCRRTLSNPLELNSSVDQTVKIQESILDEMREILSAMEDSEQFQDVVNRVLEVKRLQERIGDDVNSKGETPDNIFDKEKNIFDDK